MANILEYVLSLHDKMSGKLNSIGFSSDSALNKFAKLESQSLEVKQTMEEFGGSIGALRAKLELLRNEREWISGKNVEDIRAYNEEIKNLEKEITKLETLNGGRIKKWQEDFVTSLPGVNLIKNPLVMAGAAVGGFWSATQKAMDAGKEKIKLQTLTGSEEIGASLYKGLTDFATDTVFGSEVYDMGVQMLANGIKDSDIMPLMEQLGDISMGDSNKLGQLSLAFAQVSGKGKLAGQELLQMINAGFNPLQVISDKTGESMESLQAKMSKGEISVQQVQWAMEQATGPGGKFYNMLEKVADTPYGRLEGLFGQLEQLVINIGEAFIPFATGVMKLISWIADKAEPILKPMAFVIGMLSIGLLSLSASTLLYSGYLKITEFWTVAVAKATQAWRAAQLLLNIAMLINPFGATIAALIAFIALIGVVIGAIISVVKHWDSVKKAFTEGGILAGLKRIGVVLLDVLLKPIQTLLEMLSKIPGLKGLAGSGAKKILEIREKLDLVLPDAEGKGITAPGIPGTAGLGLGGEGGNGGGGAESGSKTNEAIATGGTKNTVINMTIGNVVETVAVSGRDFRESAKNMEEEVANAMMRVLAMATVTAN